MIWAIADIHGMFDHLVTLLRKINDNDLIIFIGDYIDRGPDSKKVLDLLMTLKQNKNYIFLMGNHEDMMLDYFEGTRKYMDGVWHYNGSFSTLKSFNYNVEKEYLDFIRDLLLYHELKIQDKKYLFVHAGVDPEKSLIQQDRLDLLWIRDKFLLMDDRYYDYTIIHGHTPTQFITGNDKIYIKKDKNNRIISVDIDTGCVYDGKLTALGITEDNKFVIYQV
ncbi:MAG TPA: metallophosphoesterase family protein [Defluviitoga sp.]|nr:metallophosphoesterase family protein [Defluviitoga sp.]HPZ29293.1 metallophosphoesterase family protein [Defluviitoga sp.]HQD63203.1 metallophosphoesterase family protein [Defluviitoga sp.]